MSPLTAIDGGAEEPLRGEDLLAEVKALISARLPLLDPADPIGRVLAPLAEIVPLRSAPDHRDGGIMPEVARPKFRTVKTLAEVPGARERAGQELVRVFSARYGVRFRAVDDEREPVSRPCVATSETGEEA